MSTNNTDNANAIEIENVSKRYFQYAHPIYRLFHAAGMLRLLKEPKHYRTFWALRNINLNIPIGKRVALVGRNGAGKSTLLKLISQNSRPTAGTIRINGRVQALLEIGTGFHPELSGKENAMLALNYQGLMGEQAQALYESIVSFAELEDFIEQPVKTYSAGMFVRLAFATATAIAPQILIVDEVLGAGDGYFQAKSIERMQELVSGPGTTVLLVTHSLDMARRLCDTFVWIDRGQIVEVGGAEIVLTKYQNSIRRQEERRILARNLRLSREVAARLDAPSEDGVYLLGQIQASPQSPIDVRRLALWARGELVGEIRVGQAMDNNEHHAQFIDDRAGWQQPANTSDNTHYRRLGSGSAGSFAMLLPSDRYTDQVYEAGLEVEYRSDQPGCINLNAGITGLQPVAELPASPMTWRTSKFVVPKWVYTNLHHLDPDTENPRFGNGQVAIDRLTLLNGADQETFIFRSGETMKVRVEYVTRNAALVDNSFVVAISIFRADGVPVITLFSSTQTTLTLKATGDVTIIFSPLLLNTGDYRINVSLNAKVDLDGLMPHYTANKDLYDLHAERYTFRVEQGLRVDTGLFHHPVSWFAE